MPRPKKFKWKCKECKKTNWVKKPELEKNFPTDWTTINSVVVKLRCSSCGSMNYIRVHGLLQLGKWGIKSIRADELDGIGETVNVTTGKQMDIVRYLRAQQKVTPWADLMEKETILIYQVYLEDGIVISRIRGMTRADLREDIVTTLGAALDPAIETAIIDDFEAFERRRQK